MYTFVYRTFIKFILFCRGQALDAGSTSLLFQLGNLFFNFLSVLIGNNLFIQSISLIYRDTANLFLPGTGTFCLGLELLLEAHTLDITEAGVSMPSRAWVVTPRTYSEGIQQGKFQCPLGLELLLWYLCMHLAQEVFQCPLGLIPHFYQELFNGRISRNHSVNALSGLYLISTHYEASIQCCVIRQVSMPSRAYTSFLQYPFKNLGFMRFPEPVFAGIYQNILTTSVFRAC